MAVCDYRTLDGFACSAIYDHAHCPRCATVVIGRAMCDYHGQAESNNWAKGNRVLCDLLHRGIAPERLSVEDREDPFWHLEGPV